LNILFKKFPEVIPRPRSRGRGRDEIRNIRERKVGKSGEGREGKLHADKLYKFT